MKNKNLPLIIGISLPLLFILVISVVIFTPSLFVKPQHNFIYTTEDNYYYGTNQGYKNAYVIKNNRIVLEPIPPREPLKENDVYKGDMPALYLYDVKNNSSQQISLEEAKALALVSGPSSPDGYIVEYQYEHDGIFELFGSRNGNDGYFISKDNGKKKLNGLTGDRYSGQRNFKLIGWVK